MPLLSLKIAKQETIGAFLAGQKAYLDNASRDLLVGPSERAMQEKCSERYMAKQKKKEQILDTMLRKANNCNQELGSQVETGSL